MVVNVACAAVFAVASYRPWHDSDRGPPPENGPATGGSGLGGPSAASAAPACTSLSNLLRDRRASTCGLHGTVAAGGVA